MVDWLLKMEICLDKDHPSLVVVPRMWELVVEELKYQTMYVCDLG